MVITISCPSCHTSFPADPKKIPEGGVKVRCSACAHVFRVEKPAPAESEPVAAPRAAIGEGATATEEPRPAASEPPPPSGERTPPEEPESAEESEPAEESGPADEPEAAGSEPSADGAWFAGAEDGRREDSSTTGDGAVAADEEHRGTPGAAQAAAVPDASSEEEPSSAPVQGFTFGKRDPTDKARRLARVLVSDMVMYNAERHQVALSQNTLAEDFEEEIEKSWKEFVDQVGPAMAEGEGRGFWTQALNEILAKGRNVF